MSLMMFAAVAVDPLSYALMGVLSGLDLKICSPRRVLSS
jgi:hypothetical protein